MWGRASAAPRVVGAEFVMSSRILITLTTGILLGMMLCISGCQKPESAITTAESDEEEAQGQPEEYGYYGELIAAAGECAIKNNGEKPENYDFSSVIYMKKDWDYGTLGYLIKDIDGNETRELIFGGNADESSSWYDGIIYDIYTISDGELVHVLDGWERSRYFLCENGMIAHEGSGSAFDGANSYFTLEGDELHFVESVAWNYEGDSGAWVCYYASESGSDTENAEMEMIRAEQADAVIEKYLYERIEFIPFEGSSGPDW